MNFFKRAWRYRKKMYSYLVTKKLIFGVCKDIKKHWLKFWTNRKKSWLKFWKNVDAWLAKKSWKGFAKKIPVNNNQIMFRTYQDEYACNPKYLCDEIIRQGLDYELVWVWSKKTVNKDKFPPQVKLIRYGTLAYYQELARSKFWIDNAHNFTWEEIYKKPEQVLINLWHGSMGLKRINAESDTNARRVAAGKRANKTTDYCIANSAFEENVFRTTYWPDTPIKHFGHPRNDLMFAGTEELAEIKTRVCEELGIEPDSKIFLYAPTFRDGKDFECFNIDYPGLRNALEERFGGNWTILSRFHFHTKLLLKRTAQHIDLGEYDFVISADNYADMQELIAVADVALTDYSSWICDFVLTRRPGFLFTADIDTYVTERGFYYPLEDTPFPIARNNEELISNVLSFDENKYEKDIVTYFDKLGCCEDGHAAQRIVSLMQEEKR